MRGREEVYEGEKKRGGAKRMAHNVNWHLKNLCSRKREIVVNQEKGQTTKEKGSHRTSRKKKGKAFRSLMKLGKKKGRGSGRDRGWDWLRQEKGKRECYEDEKKEKHCLEKAGGSRKKA